MARLQVFVALEILLALCGSVSSIPLGPDASAPNTIEHPEVGDNEYCYSCVKIDTTCYNHSYLFEINAPFGDHIVINKIALMNDKNVLYYSFEPPFSDTEFSKIGYVSLDSQKYAGVIKGQQDFNFGPFDINQHEKKVYLGGTDGIWVVSSTSHVPKFFAAKSNLITNVVSQDYVYFTKEGHAGIIKDKDGKYDFLLEGQTIKHFVLDKPVEYNIVYSTSTGLFVSFNSKSQRTPVRLSKYPFYQGLTVDQRQTVYAWNVDGIHKVTVGKVLSESTLKRVSSIIVPDAMTFDEANDIIYTKGKKLYKLTKANTKKCMGA